MIQITLWVDTANLRGVESHTFTLDEKRQILHDERGWKTWVLDDRAWRLETIDDLLTNSYYAASWHKTQKEAMKAQRQRLAKAYADLDKVAERLAA